MPFYTQNAYIDAWRGNINLEAEETYPVFRYNDLTPKAREKFSIWLKTDSSIMTIRNKAKEGEISRVLTDLNPILMNAGWRGGFSNSSIYRWREKRISSLVFNSLYRRNPRNINSWALRWLVFTPEEAMRRANLTFHCPHCDRDVLWAERHYSGVCTPCSRQPVEEFSFSVTREYAKYSDGALGPLPPMQRAHRPSSLRGRCHQLWLGIRKLRSRWR